ncbi:aldo/keto reductase [Amycolatopsis jejuensis]|uniref:aldo/keto reductase n=1 Tax=Amycolatopsis jejuensis TaxID=330084 RepID=UPI00052533BB|nr:aldo/keto reductase [Amycolatopsis jejuensis]
MELRNVGRSGLRVSAVGLGCNNFGHSLDQAESSKVINVALDLGVTVFDTAPVYGASYGASEEVLGRGLGRRRDEAVVVTKFGVPADRANGFNTSRAAVLREIEASLTRLGTDHVDLYLLHWPDWTTPVEETLRALDDIVTSGKARYLGACNLSSWRFVEAHWIARTRRLHEFLVAQNEYSLAQRTADTDLLPALEEYGAALMPYAPLANGLLTGKYSTASAAPRDSRLGRNLWKTGDRHLTSGSLHLADALARFAAERGHTLLELAMSWLLSNPHVCTVIGGATNPGQVEANVSAGRGWRLDAEEFAEVDRICRAAEGAGR